MNLFRFIQTPLSTLSRSVTYVIQRIISPVPSSKLFELFEEGIIRNRTKNCKWVKIIERWGNTSEMDKLAPSDLMVNGHCIRNWKFDASFRIELAGVSYACFVLSSFSLNFPTQLQFRWKNIWESILFHEFFRNLSMRNKILRTTRIYDFQKRNTIKKRHWSFIPLRRNSKKK